MKNKIIKTCLLTAVILILGSIVMLTACTPKTVTAAEEKFVGTYKDTTIYTMEIKQDNTLKLTGTNMVGYVIEEEYTCYYNEKNDIIVGTINNEDGTSSSITLKAFTYGENGKYLSFNAGTKYNRV